MGLVDLQQVRRDALASGERARPVTTRAPACRGFRRITTPELFEPLPPLAFLVSGLGLAPGAPTMVGGYGYSGKTLTAQAMALDIASGRNVWGQFPCQQGRVLHIDFEQGRRLTAERYQRLARGSEIHVDELGGRLELVTFPHFYLDQSRAADVLARESEGVALVVIDSLKASAPSLEENSSDARRVLDMLTRTSEKTGAVFEVIHHARKPQRDSTGGAKMAIRGSSALFDACQSVFVFTAAKGEPIHVHHEKARLTGLLHEDFALTIEDVEQDGDPRGALRVRVDDLERLACEAAEQKNDALCEAVLAFVRDNPGCTQREIRTGVTGQGNRITAATDRLARTGAIKNLGTGQRQAWHACGPGGVV